MAAAPLHQTSGYPNAQVAHAPMATASPSSALASHIAPDKATVVGLKQLAAVLEVVARLDSTGEVRYVGKEVLEERKALEYQLARRRDFERRDKASRDAYARLVEERCKLQVGLAESQRNITHLQDELCIVEREVKHAQETLEVLRDPPTGSTAHGNTSAARGTLPTPEMDRHVSVDTLSKVQKQKKKLDKDRHEIEDLRRQIALMFRQKIDAQALQQKLLQRQRQTDQDRANMLIAVEAERRKLAALSVTRLDSMTHRTAAHSRATERSEAEWLVRHKVPPTTHSVPDRSAPARSVPEDAHVSNPFASQPFSSGGMRAMGGSAPAMRQQPPRTKGVPYQEGVVGGSSPPMDRFPGSF
mmetsp:Transcript_57655/g.137129  ORF Transcript_57655/g.137129 Transcript_57655/m.137129 type:complete len:358 (+) Transcript_57655:105-1178(+)